MASNEYNIDDKYTIVVEEQDTFQLELNKQGPQGERGPIGPVGPQGDKGEKGDQGIQGEVGPKGDTGVSVVGVEEISKVGLIATYRMTFSNGEYFDYEVTDGSIDGLTREHVISLIGYEPASYTSVEGLTTRVATLEGRVEDLTASRANVSLNNLDEVGEKRFTDIQVALDGKQDKGTSGSGLEVCDIGMALYVDETKGLRRYLNGQIVDINTNTQAFLNRLKQIQATNPEYFTDEATWQSEATLNIDGCVYKFVLNYSGDNVVSVRLPKYPDYVEINAGGTLPVVGNGMTLGVTDNNGNYGLGADSNAYVKPMISAYGTNAGTSSSSSSNINKTIGITTDPTKSGIETTLNKTKLKMRYFIQIATGSETENNIINEIELNNPFTFGMSQYYKGEMNNLSWLKSDNQWNSGAVYSGLYNWLLEKVNQLSYDSSKFVITGNPTITDNGIANGFTSNDYVKTTNINYGGGGLETIIFNLTFIPSESQSHTTIFESVEGWEILYTNDNTLEATNDSGQTCSVTTTESMVGKECKVNFISGSFFQQLEVTIGNNKYSGNEENNVSSGNTASQLQIGSPIYASSVNTTSFKGSIDLSSLKITYNGSVVFSVGSVRKNIEGFKLSTDTDITDYDFVINTTDESFRLPLKNGDNIIFAPKEGSGSILETLTTSKTTWEESTFTAPVTGWYWAYGTGNITSSSIRSLFLGKGDTDIEWQSARSVGPQGRDLETNHIWLNKGETFMVNSVEVRTRKTYYIEADIPNLYYYVGETVQNANLINAGRIGEQLANKQDKLSRYPIEISDKSLMPSWYVVYNDGWCEQGGYISGTDRTISLLKEYNDTNYYINVSPKATDGGYPANYETYSSRVTTTSFYISHQGTGGGSGSLLGYSWETAGYIS